MDFTASPTDVIKAVNTAREVEPNPFVLAGRFVGLSGAEARAGVPAWAWCVLAFGAGALAVHPLASVRARGGLRAIS